MQNRAQMKESKCAKDKLKCANEKRRVQVITNPSSRLEKHRTLDFLLRADFYELKKNQFLLFRCFRKSSAAHTKTIVCVLSHVNMLDQTQYSVLAIFLTIFLRLVSTSGFNVKF